MPVKGAGPGETRVVDRWEGGLTWMAHPAEAMERASHALVVDDAIWLVDPVDAVDLGETIGELGDVAGVVVTSSWHSRDAAAIADRHGVPVFLHRRHDPLASSIGVPVDRFGDELGETGFRSIVVETRFWTEVGLYHPDRRTLVVGDSLVTRDGYTAPDERLAVLPVYRRIAPPRDALGGLAVDRVLVGHGAGIHESATAALDVALRGARRNAPAALLARLPRLLRAGLVALRE